MKELLHQIEDALLAFLTAVFVISLAGVIYRFYVWVIDTFFNAIDDEDAWP